MKESIELKDVSFYPDLITDYLNGKLDLSLFNHDSDISNIEKQIALKGASYAQSRDDLSDELLTSYNNINDVLAIKNIKLLKQENTFTVSTGHQLNLFTGPVYFLYKIIHTICLAATLGEKFPAYNFVPVYWMASEDHDFEEINHFNLFNKKYVWNSNQSGAVGRFNLEDFNLEELLKENLSEKDFFHPKIQEFLKSFSSSNTLSEAHFKIVTSLFNNKGLVVIDADNKVFKKCMQSVFISEIEEQLSFKNVIATNKKLTDLNYKIQVNPRKINLFYLEGNIRERIIFNKEDNLFIVNNTTKKFTKNELIELINVTPEKISPNVVLRPLYQEKLLPNILYIGGAGEISYWLQLKQMFDAYSVVFPMLIVRKSFLYTKNLDKKIKLIDTDYKTILTTTSDHFTKSFFNNKAINNSLSVEKYKLEIEATFSSLLEIADNLDLSLIPSIESEKTKVFKGIDKIQQKFEKVLKQKDQQSLKAIEAIYKKVYPNNIFQERFINLLDIYLTSPNNYNFIDELFRCISTSDSFNQGELILFD